MTDRTWEVWIRYCHEYNLGYRGFVFLECSLDYFGYNCNKYAHTKFELGKLRKFKLFNKVVLSFENLCERLDDLFRNNSFIVYNPEDGDVVQSLIVKSSIMPLTLLVGVKVDLNIKKWGRGSCFLLFLFLLPQVIWGI